MKFLHLSIQNSLPNKLLCHCQFYHLLINNINFSFVSLLFCCASFHTTNKKSTLSIWNRWRKKTTNNDGNKEIDSTRFAVVHIACFYYYDYYSIHSNVIYCILSFPFFHCVFLQRTSKNGIHYEPMECKILWEIFFMKNSCDKMRNEMTTKKKKPICI